MDLFQDDFVADLKIIHQEAEVQVGVGLLRERVDAGAVDFQRGPALPDQLQQTLRAGYGISDTLKCVLDAGNALRCHGRPPELLDDLGRDLIVDLLHLGL